MTPNLATAESPFFLIYRRDPNLPLHQLLEPMQWFLGDPDSGLLNLEAHSLALAIAKKTLDENCFRTAQKAMDRQAPSFKIGDRVYFKNKQPGKWIQNSPNWAWWTFSALQKPSYWKSMVLKPEGCSTWISSRILEHWYTIWHLLSLLMINDDHSL